MKLSDENKKQIIQGLLEIFARIADESYQRRVWAFAEGPECDDFDETACLFFDIGDPVLEDYKNFNISDHQYALLSNFRNKFKAFSSNHPIPQEFISSDAWKEIQALAKEVLLAFNYRKEA